MTQQKENIIPIQETEEQRIKKKNKQVLKNLESVSVKSAHGAIDFIAENCILGFNITVRGEEGSEGESVFIINDNANIRIEQNPAVLKLNNQDYIINGASTLPNIDERWGFTNLKKFIKKPTCPTDLFESMHNIIKIFLELQFQTQYSLVALWAISTYFTHLFHAFPFIFIFGPKGTGKSKQLELLSSVVFNGQKLTQVTEAALCDATDSMRCTVFLDQAEHLPRKLIGLLADSYKKAGAKRWIIERKKGNRVVSEFSGYGAKCFAATRLPDRDLADRGPIFKTIKSKKSLPDVIGDSNKFKVLRDGCYRFLLTCHENVEKIYQDLPADGTRMNELWRPLEAVAIALNIPKTEITQIKDTFDKAYDNTLTQASATDLGLFQVFKEYIFETEKETDAKDQEHFEKTPGEIISDLKGYVDKNSTPTPQWVGKRLVLYSLINQEDKRKVSRKKYMNYRFNKTQVKNIIGRYIDIEENQQ